MTFQERVGAFEAEAKGRIRRALSTGNAKLMELDGALAKVTKDDWSVPGLKKQLEQLRARAEKARTTAMKRVQQMPGEAVSKLATGSRRCRTWRRASPRWRSASRRRRRSR